MNQEKQIQKMKHLLSSSDEANFKLGFQLLENLGHLEGYQEKLDLLKKDSQGETFELSDKANIQFTKDVAKKLEFTKQTHSELFFKRLHFITHELTFDFLRTSPFSFSDPDKLQKVKFIVFLSKTQCYLTQEVIHSREAIFSIIKHIEFLNQMKNKLELSKLHRKVMAQGEGISYGSYRKPDRLAWLEIRRKSDLAQPIRYEVLPYDKNYKVFKIQIMLKV